MNLSSFAKSFVFAAVATSLAGTIHASEWIPVSGNWSDPVNWDTNPVIPDGPAAIAQFTGAATSTTTVDSARTVGTLNLGGSSDIFWSILANAPLTFDQDGAGPGFATISNTNTNPGAINQIVLPTLGAGGSYVLADDLHLVNSSAATTNYAIWLQGIISGAGNLTFRNESTSSTNGFIRIFGVNTFVGNSLIQKGVTAFSNSASAFGPSASNSITIGDASGGGQGNATLLGITAVTLPHAITVASGSGGTLSLGFNLSSATAHGYSGLITLNDNLNLLSADAGTNVMLVSGKVTGTGSLTIVGPGRVRLSGATSDFTGGTTLTSGTLVLGANSTPTSGTVTSGPLGTGSLFLNGGTLSSTSAITLGNAIVANASTTSTIVHRGASGTNLVLTGPVTGTGTIRNATTTSQTGTVLDFQGDISNFEGTFDFVSDISNSNTLRFVGTTPTLVVDGSKAKFAVNITGTGNRPLRFGGAPVGGVASTTATLKMGELSGTTATANVFGDASTSNTLEVGALNTNSSYAGFLRGTNFSLRKVGTGSLTLSGATSTYTNGTTISAGSLIAGGNAAPTGGVFGIPAVPALMLNDADTGSNDVSLLTGGAFTISLPVQVNNLGSGVTTIGGQTNHSSTFSGAITLDKNASVTSAAIGQNAVAITGPVSGVGGLTKVGPGRVILSDAKTFTGTTAVNAGTLQYAHLTSLYNGVTADWNKLSVNSGATGMFNVGGAGEFTSADIDTVRSSATFAAGSILGFDTANAGGSFNYASTIGGVIGVAKAGAGTLTLNAGNTYDGPTFIQQGTVTVTSLNSVGGGASELGSPTTVANGTIHLGSGTATGMLSYTGTGGSTDRVINLAGTTGNGGIDSSGTGALHFTSNLTTTGDGAKSLALQGSNTDNNTFAGAIANSAASTGIVKTGAGKWILSGANTYSGTTEVNEGTLTVSGSHTADAANYRVGNTASSTGTVNVDTGTISTTGILSIRVGEAAGSDSTFNQTGGTITGASGGSEYWVGGAAGKGTATQSGGTHTTGYVAVGFGDSGQTSTFTLSGPTSTTLNVTTDASSELYLGIFGDAAMTQTGGTVNVGRIFHLGWFAGSEGTYTISGANGDALNNSNSMMVGRDGKGTVNQSGGTVAIVGTPFGTPAAHDGVESGDLVIGRTAGAEGAYNLSGGVLGAVRIGQGLGTGGFSFSGGTLIVGTFNTAAYGGDLGGLTQTASSGPSVLDVTNNDTTINGTYALEAGTANVGTGRTLTTGTVVLTGGGAINGPGAVAGTLYDLQNGSVSASLTGSGVNLTKTTADTVTLSGTNTYTGDTTVTEGTLDISGSHETGANYSVATTGNLITNNIRIANTLTIDGVATINADGGTAGASKAETLTINSGGKLNLANNDLVVGTAADVFGVRSQIKLGRIGMADNVAGANGITSDMMTVSTHGFGYAAGNDARLSPLVSGPQMLSGQTFDADSVLVKFTYRGDADLDGDSDLDDLGHWANAFTGDLGLGSTADPTTLWTQGDWDYDGDTDLDDLGFWSSTFTGDLGGGGLSVYAPNASEGAIAALAGMGITAVPEPGSISILAMAFGLFGLRCARRLKRVPGR